MHDPLPTRAARRALALAGPLALLAVASAAPGAGPDLAALPRTLAKEPAYAGRPAYALLVMGAEARQRAWLVLDGATAYLDRNGNGDLTEAGEKVVLEGGAEVDETPDVKVTLTQFDLGELPAPSGPPRYTGLTLTRLIAEPKPGSSIPAADDVTLNVSVGGTHTQQAKPRLAARAAQAPVIHVDGPLVAQAPPQAGGTLPSLTKGAEDQELTIQIGTPGLGEGSWCAQGYEQVPEDCKPLLEVAFPAAKAGDPPVVLKFTLDDRC